MPFTGFAYNTEAFAQEIGRSGETAKQTGLTPATPADLLLGVAAPDQQPAAHSAGINALSCIGSAAIAIAG
jgi:hypothetical protein